MIFFFLADIRCPSDWAIDEIRFALNWMCRPHSRAQNDMKMKWKSEWERNNFIKGVWQFCVRQSVDDRTQANVCFFLWKITFVFVAKTREPRKKQAYWRLIRNVSRQKRAFGSAEKLGRHIFNSKHMCDSGRIETVGEFLGKTVENCEIAIEFGSSHFVCVLLNVRRRLPNLWQDDTLKNAMCCSSFTLALPSGSASSKLNDFHRAVFFDEWRTNHRVSVTLRHFHPDHL